ncbi:hypothetical protein [Flavobacterium sp. JAS]|jgi:hypothetical protein|uniref:hypothetical protein n=1 Tax=Flavobacterium sp. JAS TaxID=2897329 RepID=UPI001E28F93E|nr:hypothetical protein [Flavobacterium sp. JAS]MCD0470912.1 hypothetical protein [Flavobacterium sp. JAS]
MKEILIFCFVIFAFNLAVSFFRTQFSKKKGQEILKLYRQEKLEKVDVKISETRYSRFSNRGGTLCFLKCTMYYSENVLIFTQNENSNFAEINFTLPLVVHPVDIKNIFIKTDEYILNVGNSKSGRKLQIFSDSENELLKVIFNGFKKSLIPF